MTNGYIIVNAAFDLSAAEAVTVSGITDSINEAIGANKPIILSGLVDDDVDVSPLPVAAEVTADGIVLYGATFIITIGASDSVTVEKVVNVTPTKTTKSSK